MDTSAKIERSTNGKGREYLKIQIHLINARQYTWPDKLQHNEDENVVNFF